jgi:hypothetical protein
MVFNVKNLLYSVGLVLLCNILSAQESYRIGIAGGYRALFSKTSFADRLTKYPLNYHAYSPGYYMSLSMMRRNFFLRSSFSGYKIIHSHGVYNNTVFSRESPKNKNIRNTNTARDINLDVGYDFPFYFLNVRLFSGLGWITTGDREWTTSNRPVQMLVPVNVNVTTTLDIFSQAFQSQTYYSNFGFGLSWPLYARLRCEFDVAYQTYFSTLAANYGDYRNRTKEGFGLGGEFSSQLTGAWLAQLGISFSINGSQELK